MLELHLHGGRAVIKSVLKAIEEIKCQEQNGSIRYALPGEFSQRAFQNGRMDLTQAEGLAELIDAETETQRRSAVSSVRGQNKALFESWRSRIVSNIAQLTAIIDFGEDTEITDIDNILESVQKEMRQLNTEIRKFMSRVERSSILQDGIKVALLGAPNAGKSSLLNCVTKDETSIVSDIPGTTRDAIDVPIDINGYKVIICDTAGIRQKSTDQIEIQGMKRAKAKGSASDLIILVVDPTRTPYVSEDLKSFVKDEMSHKQLVVVINKKDLIDMDKIKHVSSEIRSCLGGDFPVLAVSCTSLEGTEELMASLSAIFQSLSATGHDLDPIIVSKRTNEILSKDVLFGIEGFLTFSDAEDVVMASESLSYAAEGIGKITGDSVGVEEILGIVFARFCVGK